MATQILPPEMAGLLTIMLAGIALARLLGWWSSWGRKPSAKMPPVSAVTPRTLSTWREKGGYKLQNGEEVKVASASSGAVYIVKRARAGDSVYCSCPAWKYQRLHPTCRTCKHCTAVVGAGAGAIRVARATKTRKDLECDATC